MCKLTVVDTAFSVGGGERPNGNGLTGSRGLSSAKRGRLESLGERPLSRLLQVLLVRLLRSFVSGSESVPAGGDCGEGLTSNACGSEVGASGASYSSLVVRTPPSFPAANCTEALRRADTPAPRRELRGRALCLLGSEMPATGNCSAGKERVAEALLALLFKRVALVD